MSIAKAYVAKTGVITAVGQNTIMTAASINAGIMRISESEFYDEDYNPAKMALVPDEAIDSVLDGEKIIYPLTARQFRMLQLSTVALKELGENFPESASLPLFIAGPESVVQSEPSIDNQFIKNLSIQAGVEIDLNNSRFIATGRAGGIDVIDLAFKYFEQSGAQAVIIGGVDTYCDQNIIDYYVEEERLLASDIMDGFIPGEGAGFMLLLSDKASASAVSKCKCYITEPGSGFEDGYIGSQEIYTGKGLAECVKTALSNVDVNMTQIPLIMSSLNGESYFAKELGVAVTRNKNLINENFEVQHIAEYCGDLGAAIGPIMLSVFCFDGCAAHTSGLAYCSSDNGFRSAVCISKCN